MAVLGAMQSAAIRLGMGRPTAFFTSSNKFEQEIADLINEVARAIRKSHDWRTLTKLCILSGDGTTVEHNFPADYDRMPKKSEIHSKSWGLWRVTPAKDLDEWLDYQTHLPAGVPGAWFVLGGKMGIYPAIPTGEQAKFYYISRSITPDGKAAFDDDNDAFVLNERLLTLGLIWRWRSQKKMEYAEDLRNYEIALEEEIATEKGSRLLTSGPTRLSYDARFSYPGPLG